MDVTLIGDSIRMGYQPLVARALAGRAAVWGPDENGRTSSNVLQHLDEWVTHRDVDVVHLNCGLHDLAIQEDGQNQVPLEQYQSNLQDIFHTITHECAGRFVWATTTPVIDEWHLAVKAFVRRQKDVMRYNEAALRLCIRYDVDVDDLHEVIVRADPARCLCKDGVHMNDYGNRLLCDAVAAAVAL